MRRICLIFLLIFSAGLISAQTTDSKQDTFNFDSLIEKLDSLFENEVMISPFDEDFMKQFEDAFPEMHNFQFNLDSLDLGDIDIENLLENNQDWNFSSDEFESMMEYGLQMLEGMNLDSLNNIFDQLNLNGMDFQFLEPLLKDLEMPDTTSQKDKHLKKI